jgi:hypothetical protein
MQARLPLLFLLTVAPAVCADPQSTIQAEIERVRQALQDRPLEASLSGVATDVQQRLKVAADAAANGRLYFALERLGQALNSLSGARATADLASSAGVSLPAFEKEWARASAELDTLHTEVGAHNWASAPAALRALAEAATGRTGPLLDGARGFATSTQPRDGLFYLGQARGESDFARFCARLDLVRQRRAPNLRSLLPELEAMQTKVNAAFVPPRSIEQHPIFISLNSTLKLARELDSAKRYAGALYQYLEAVRLFHMLDAQSPDAPTQAALRNTVRTEREKLAASHQDDSIARLFFERSLSQVQHADGSATTPDEWRAAVAIARAILPAYRDALRPSTGTRNPPGKTVEITLVRWPYT